VEVCICQWEIKELTLVKFHETRMGEKQREFLMAVLADRRHQPQVVPSIRDFKI
jgi:hypothetical protein